MSVHFQRGRTEVTLSKTGLNLKDWAFALHSAPCGLHHVAQFPVKLHIPTQQSYTLGI